MNEHDFYKQMIHDRTVNDAMIKARIKTQAGGSFAWKRAAAIAAFAFAILVGTAFAIPSARAEILSWFHVSTPQDYLATDKDARAEIPELNSLISSPESENGFVLIPIDRTDSKAVNSEGALKMSDFFYQNCDIQLGDAMFDGQYFYQTVHLNGLSGLYLLEEYTGGWQTGVKVDPYAVWGLYEDGPEEEYLTGKWTLYERPFGRVIYELQDGTRMGGAFDLGTAIDPYLDTLFEKGLIGETSPGNAQEQIDALNRAYLEQNGLNAVAPIWAQEEIDFANYTDSDGNLRVKVLYEVDVCEEERGDGNFVPSTELFKAQLGTITVNMHAYQDIQASQIESADSEIKWGAEKMVISRIDFDHTTRRLSFYKQHVSTEGVLMSAESADMDALGIRDIQIRVRVPESWSKLEREAFAASLKFKALINGESGKWIVNSYNCTVQEDGTILFHSAGITELPYDMLKSIKTVALVPILQVTDRPVELLDKNDHKLSSLDPEYGELVWSEPGVEGWDTDETKTEFPQYAIVLNVQ